MALTLETTNETEEPEDNEQEIDPFNFMELVAADNTKSRGPLYFDFETVPDSSRSNLLDDEASRDEIEYPDIETLVGSTVGDIKDVISGFPYNDETIDYLVILERAEKDGKARSGVTNAIRSIWDSIKSYDDDRRKALSVTPELCSIAAIGWAVGDGPTHSVLTLTDADESRGVEEFWRLVKAFSPVIGFNIVGFDLPVLYVRSMILGVKPLKKLDMRPWGNDVIDLMVARYPRSKATGLKTLAKYHGFEVPAGDVDGSQVADLCISDPEMVRTYVESDVEITRKLHLAYRGTFC